MSFTVRAHMDASDSSANTDSTFGPDYSLQLLHSLDDMGWESGMDTSMDKCSALAAATAALQLQQQQQVSSPFTMPPPAGGLILSPKSSAAAAAAAAAAATAMSTPPPPSSSSAAHAQQQAPPPPLGPGPAATASAAAAARSADNSFGDLFSMPAAASAASSASSQDKCWVEVHHLAPSTTGVMLMTLFYPHGADEARTIREHGQLLGLVRFRCSEMASRAADKMNAFFPLGQNQALRVLPVSTEEVQAALARAKLQPISTLYAALSEEGMNPTRVAMIVESMPFLQAARELSEEVLHADQHILSRITDTIMSMSPHWTHVQEFGAELLQRLHLALIQTNCCYQSTSCGVVIANLFLHHILPGDPFLFATNFLQRIGLRVPHVEGVCMLAHICSPMEFKVSKASFWALVREIACTTNDVAISKALLNHLQRYLRHCSHQDLLLPAPSTTVATTSSSTRASSIVGQTTGCSAGSLLHSKEGTHPHHRAAGANHHSHNSAMMLTSSASTSSESNSSGVDTNHHHHHHRHHRHATSTQRHRERSLSPPPSIITSAVASSHRQQSRHSQPSHLDRRHVDPFDAAAAAAAFAVPSPHGSSHMPSLSSGSMMGDRALGVGAVAASPTFSTSVWSTSNTSSPLPHPTSSSSTSAAVAAAAAAAAAVEDAKLRTVYISHLPPNLPQNVFMSLLSRCGPVNKVRICAGKGYATLFSFVEMGTIAGAQEVTKLSGFNYLGFSIRVQTAKNPIQDDLKEDAEVLSNGVVRQRCLFGLSSAPLVNAISATDAK